jgi:hypothetical protein
MTGTKSRVRAREVHDGPRRVGAVREPPVLEPVVKHERAARLACKMRESVPWSTGSLSQEVEDQGATRRACNMRALVPLEYPT